jgi:2-methylcitrate dehydratase MmgE/PrpD-like protein
MSNATSHAGASQSVAEFVAAAHAGAEFDAALRPARALLTAARTALQTPTAESDLASRALASYGTPLRRTFADATTLAATPDGRGDAPIVAAALASGELLGRSDTDIAEAIAVGREVAARLERALAFDAPWDAVAVSAGIGAAAAAARAAGLDSAAARDAIGIAATQAASLGAVEGTPAAALACGKAAADAVEAALLALHGFTAASASLEGRRGLAALMASGFDEAALCDGLGRRWFSAAF